MDAQPAAAKREKQARGAWACKPGGFDALNASRLFPAANPPGIPDLLPAPLSAVPDHLVAYRQRVRAQGFDPARAAVHFFLDDYRFETVWARPLRALEHLAKYPTLLTPDFSLYADWPAAMQLWNVYRARWCGRYWQERGFRVIPTVSWSTPASFEFCFLGLPRHSLLAVSSVGVDFHQPAQLNRFLAGFGAMVQRLDPTLVLSYGPLPAEAYAMATVRVYPTRWDGRSHQTVSIAWESSI